MTFRAVAPTALAGRVASLSTPPAYGRNGKSANAEGSADALPGTADGRAGGTNQSLLRLARTDRSPRRNSARTGLRSVPAWTTRVKSLAERGGPT